MSLLNLRTLIYAHARTSEADTLYFDLEQKTTNNDGDGNENVTYKVKSRCFKLHRAYSISFNLTKSGKVLMTINNVHMYHRQYFYSTDAGGAEQMPKTNNSNLT